MPVLAEPSHQPLRAPLHGKKTGITVSPTNLFRLSWTHRSFLVLTILTSLPLPISRVNKTLGRARDPRANGTWLRRTENCSEEQEGMEERLGEMRKGREDEKGSHCFSKSSGYDKLELKHQNFVISSL